MKKCARLLGILVVASALAQDQDPFEPGSLDAAQPSDSADTSPPPAPRTPPSQRPTSPSSAPIPGPTKSFSVSPNTGTTGKSGPGSLSADDDALALEESIRNQLIEGQFEYQDAEIQDVVRAISKLTKKNFILDPKVRGKITIMSPAKVTVQEVYEAFLSALEINEYTLVTAGKYLKIIRHQDAARANIKTYSGTYTPDNDNYITRIYPLKYINAEDVARELRELTPRYGKITPYAPTNTVVITDTGRNIRRLIQIIQLLDVRGFELELTVIPIRHAPAKELATLIDSIISEASPDNRAAGARRAGAGRSNVKKTEGGGEIAKIVPEERTNSLIVLANSQGIRDVRGLVQKLDLADTLTQSGSIHVYYCKHSDATELAQTLAALSGKGTGPNSTTRSGTRSATPEMQGIPNLGGAGGGGQITAEFEGGVKITADKATNSLVVVASKADYETMLKVIGRLDIPRKQVYVEAVVMEVRVNDNLNFGIHYNYAVDGIPRAVGFSPNTDLVSYFSGGVGLSGLILGIAKGKSTSQTIDGKSMSIKSVTSLITAIQTYSESNILSTPQIMAIDNEESEIKITDKIPVNSGSSSTTTAVTQNVTEKNLGISLKLTPQISGDMIRMKLDTSVTNLSAEKTPKGLSDSNISTTERSAKTVVVVPDTDTVVIGGLIQETVLETQTKIPILGDIPILGWLFKGTEKVKRKTNLLIFLTPTIVEGTQSATLVTESKLDTRKTFLKTNLGGNDTFKTYIKDLRDKMEVQKQKPEKNLHRSPEDTPIENSFDSKDDRNSEEDQMIDDIKKIDQEDKKHKFVEDSKESNSESLPTPDSVGTKEEKPIKKTEDSGSNDVDTILDSPPTGKVPTLEGE